eukprot:1384350-Rhodomonas_salina.1
MMLRLSVLMLVLAAAVPLGDAFVVHNAGSMLRSFNGQGAAACSTRTPRNMQVNLARPQAADLEIQRNHSASS